MKKIMTLAAMFAAVMMGVSSCNPDDTTPTQKPDTEQNGENNSGEENGGEENGGEEYVSPITIDGDFADWDALDASKVAVATCAEGANWTAMKSVKVYADANFINVLIEVDADEISGDAPIDVYLNTDNDESEFSNNFLGEAAMDYLLEGAYYAESAEGAADWAIYSLDAGFFAYGGTPDAEAVWAFESLISSGVTKGAGTLAKYEFSIDAKKLVEEADVVFEDTFGFGITVSQSWNPVGLLPNVTPTDENGKGSANFMSVTINK